jgi:hypothetical protein
MRVEPLDEDFVDEGHPVAGGDLLGEDAEEPGRREQREGAADELQPEARVGRPPVVRELQERCQIPAGVREPGMVEERTRASPDGAEVAANRPPKPRTQQQTVSPPDQGLSVSLRRRRDGSRGPGPARQGS